MVFTSADRQYMQEALKEARKAFDQDEVPIGAVIVQEGRVIGRGWNQVEQLRDSTAHAEILALTAAFHFLGSKYVPDATIYITIEPCLMCAGALYWSKIKKIIYGAPDEKNGYLRVAARNWPFHPKTRIDHGLFEEECSTLIKEFFARKREK